MSAPSTRDGIKTSARRLFANSGLDDVSIRDIARAAGQKSSGAVNYHFRSKDDLIRELILDTVDATESYRNSRIDALEAAGGPDSIREVLGILVDYQVLDRASRSLDDVGLRFLNMIMINHRDLLFKVMREERADQGTRRCMAHLRRMLPDMPPVLARQRLMMVISHLFAAASSREASLAEGTNGSLWGHPAARSNLIDTVEGMLTAPVSSETLAALGDEGEPAATRGKAARADEERRAKARARDAAGEDGPEIAAAN